MNEDVIIIGTGKVAYHFAKEISNNPKLKLIQILGRSKKINSNFNEFSNIYSSDFSEIKKSKFCIIAVSDNSVKSVSKNIKKFEGVVLHTSGSINMSILNSHLKFGVIYPLQTFSFERNIDFNKIPLLVEASNKKTLSELINFSNKLSKKTVIMNSDKRLICHLSAVFANNFTNHLIYTSEELLDKFDIDKDLIHPLFEETILKIKSISSYNAQTGPASRNDLETIKNHINFLKKNNLTSNVDIYKSITESIIKTKFDKQ